MCVFSFLHRTVHSTISRYTLLTLCPTKRKYFCLHSPTSTRWMNSRISSGVCLSMVVYRLAFSIKASILVSEAFSFSNRLFSGIVSDRFVLLGVVVYGKHAKLFVSHLSQGIVLVQELKPRRQLIISPMYGIQFPLFCCNVRSSRLFIKLPKMDVRLYRQN